MSQRLIHASPFHPFGIQSLISRRANFGCSYRKLPNSKECGPNFADWTLAYKHHWLYLQPGSDARNVWLRFLMRCWTGPTGPWRSFTGLDESPFWVGYSSSKRPSLFGRIRGGNRFCQPRWWGIGVLHLISFPVHWSAKPSQRQLQKLWIFSNFLRHNARSWSNRGW